MRLRCTVRQKAPRCKVDLPRVAQQVGPEDVMNELKSRGLEPMYHDFAEHIGSSIRVFQRAPMELIWEKE